MVLPTETVPTPGSQNAQRLPHASGHTNQTRARVSRRGQISLPGMRRLPRPDDLFEP